MGDGNVRMIKPLGPILELTQGVDELIYLFATRCLMQAHKLLPNETAVETIVVGFCLLGMTPACYKAVGDEFSTSMSELAEQCRKKPKKWNKGRATGGQSSTPCAVRKSVYTCGHQAFQC